jgi:hypothetical protein
MEHKEKLEKAALQYHEDGYTLIPLIDKKPLISGWTQDDYNPSEADIKKWFTDFSRSINGIGLRTGYVESMFVLDIEVEQDLSALDLPNDGVRSQSGRGGIHYYYRDMGELSESLTSVDLRKMGYEADVKGNNQYIVAPPSLHPKNGNEYEWIEPLGLDELPPCPDWLEELLKNHDSQKAKNDWQGVLTEPVKTGSRHTTATQVTGKLLYHIPEKEWDTIAYPLLESWNQTMCDPPLPIAEVNSIFSSLRGNQRKQNKSDMNEITVTRKPPMSVGEILEMPESERPKFLVHNIIPEKGITAIAGHPGCGKSWLMIEIARAVATGTNFLQNNDMQSKQANVLIIDEESGVWEMRRRIELLQINKEIPVHFYSLDQFKLDKEESISRLLDVCKEYDIGLIVFDPFASMHGGIENSAEEMQNVMGAMQKFNEEDVTVIFIHHHRKGGVGGNGLSLRGSSAILGRLDSLIVIEKTEDDVSQTITLKHVKSRRGKNAKSMKIAIIQPEEDAPIELLFSGEANETLLKKDQAKLLILELLKYEGLYKDQIVEAITEEDEIGERNVGQALIELVKEEKVIVSKDDRKNHYKLKNIEKDAPV